MTDAPKHPTDPDPANELASDSSPIDPRDFRNALGTYATGVTIITAAGPDGKPYGLTCNSFASVSLNPPLVLWSLGMFSQALTIFQNASHFAVNVLGASQQLLATKFAKSSEDKFAGSNGRRALAMRPFLRTASQIFSAAPPIDIMAATMLSFSARSRPTRTTGKSRCCLRAAVTASFLPTTAF